MTKSLLAESWFVTLSVLEDSAGTEAAKEKLVPYLRNAGEAFAMNMRKRFGIEGNDIDALGVFCALANLLFEIEAKEVEHTDVRIVLVSTNCPYRHCSPTVCWMGHTWHDFMVKAVNPEYEERLMQMATRGDPICSWVVERKKK